MKLQRSKAWWMTRAAAEGDHLIIAGVPVTEADAERLPDVNAAAQHRGPHAQAARPIATAAGVGATADEAHFAFGRFVNLMRRRLGFSIERFANHTQVDSGELLAIEDDVHYTPEPRTVYRLALVFKIPQERLMQLAGLAEARDPTLYTQAVRLAASADPVKQLSPDETKALEVFVAVLSQRGSDNR
jgi:HTH-type transcriptional regulator, competence development regulator